MNRERTYVQHDSSSLMPGDVRDYLCEHPDFFDDNDDLFAVLVPPEIRRADAVQDFQHHMLTRLQDNLNTVKTEQDDLMQLMQDHMQRQNQINNAVLSLMDATNLAQVLKFITEDMALLLDQEYIALFMEAGRGMETGVYGGLHVVPEGFVDRWLVGAICLSENPHAAPELFGVHAARVKSQALVRLSFGEGMPSALLALGHRDPMYYATGIATEQVECLGAVVERCLGKWV